MRTWRSLFTPCVIHFGTSPTTSASDLSGPFLGKTGLLILKDKNNKECHKCLIQSVGVQRISFVQYEQNVRIYLMTGPVSMLDSFLSRCNKVHACYLGLDTDQLFYFDSIGNSKDISDPA
uniref:CHXC33 n=1 Tax=Albugo laibachii Nc14 TaxID=890382 RepID=F0WJS4_9STRA|nr:CHXC33 [Albugo laibachii Nc14]|eukprot:CCA21525.1 CHXC33 [Albugo laibachii Nc14]